MQLTSLIIFCFAVFVLSWRGKLRHGDRRLVILRIFFPNFGKVCFSNLERKERLTWTSQLSSSESDWSCKSPLGKIIWKSHAERKSLCVCPCSPDHKSREDWKAKSCPTMGLTSIWLNRELGAHEQYLLRMKVQAKNYACGRITACFVKTPVELCWNPPKCVRDGQSGFLKLWYSRMSHHADWRYHPNALISHSQRCPSSGSATQRAASAELRAFRREAAWATAGPEPSERSRDCSGPCSLPRRWRSCSSPRLPPTRTRDAKATTSSGDAALRRLPSSTRAPLTTDKMLCAKCCTNTELPLPKGSVWSPSLRCTFLEYVTLIGWAVHFHVRENKIRSHGQL